MRTMPASALRLTSPPEARGPTPSGPKGRTSGWSRWPRREKRISHRSRCCAPSSRCTLLINCSTTDSAFPPTTRRAIRIRLIEWMPVVTMGLSCMPCSWTFPAERVFFPCHKFHMLYIHAGSISAKMVRDQPRGNCASLKLPRYSVHMHDLPIDAYLTVTARAPRSSPDKTIAFSFRL